VNYFVAGGVPKSAFVCAEDGNDASDFIGVRDGSAQATEIARNVEVIGIDAPHEALAPLPINVAPVQPQRQLTDAELAKVRALLATITPAPAPVAPEAVHALQPQGEPASADSAAFEIH